MQQLDKEGEEEENVYTMTESSYQLDGQIKINRERLDKLALGLLEDIFTNETSPFCLNTLHHSRLEAIIAEAQKSEFIDLSYDERNSAETRKKADTRAFQCTLSIDKLEREYPEHDPRSAYQELEGELRSKLVASGEQITYGPIRRPASIITAIQVARSNLGVQAMNS